MNLKYNVYNWDWVHAQVQKVHRLDMCSVIISHLINSNTYPAYQILNEKHITIHYALQQIEFFNIHSKCKTLSNIIWSDDKIVIGNKFSKLIVNTKNITLRREGRCLRASRMLACSLSGINGINLVLTMQEIARRVICIAVRHSPAALRRLLWRHCSSETAADGPVAWGLE